MQTLLTHTQVCLSGQVPLTALSGVENSVESCNRCWMVVGSRFRYSHMWCLTPRSLGLEPAWDKLARDECVREVLERPHSFRRHRPCLAAQGLLESRCAVGWGKVGGKHWVHP
jgi:hypothetical protein